MSLICLCAAPTDALAAVRTWDNDAGTGLWNNADNWDTNTLPQTGDSLVFPAALAGLVQNNLAADTEFVTLTIAEGYTVTGNRVVIANGINAVVGPGNQNAIIVCDVMLKGINPGTHSVTMHTGAGVDLVLHKVFGDQSATLGKGGPGRLFLETTNTYAGSTVVFAGGLVVKSAFGLGTNTRGTSVLAAGTLFVQVAGGAIDEPLSLEGTNIVNDPEPEALVALQDALWTGAITLTGVTSPLISVPDDGDILELRATIDGPRGLSFHGPGILTLSGAASNTYGSETSVTNGVLALAKSGGKVAIPAGLSVGDAIAAENATVRLNVPDQIQGLVTVRRSGVLDLFGHNETLGALTFVGGQVATGAGLLTVSGSITVLPAPVMAVLSGKLSTGAGDRTIDVQTADASAPALDITAELSSPQLQGLVKAGSGNLRLSGPNTYAGLTMISNGTLTAAHPSALGGPTITQLKPGGRLHLESDILTEPLIAEAGANPAGPPLASVGNGVRTWGGTILISGAFRVYAYAGSALRLDGVISGGHFKMEGDPGTSVLLGANNGYSGNTIIGTRVLLTASSRIPDTSRVELLDGGKLDLNGFNETVGGIVGASAASEVIPSGGGLSVATKNGNTDVFAGKLTGGGQIVKEGQGTWVLTGASSATAPIAVSNGKLRVTGSVASAVAVVGNGTLEGTGHVGVLTAPEGNVRPGSSPGILHSQSVTLGDGALFIAIDGPAVGTEHAQLQVTGTVNLGGVELNLIVNPNFQPAGVGALVIVDNDGSDPIIGTFAGLPDGETIDIGNGRKFRINYAGGSGNDVALEALSDTYYLAEGATGSFFDLDILIANPNPDPAPVTLTFLREDGGTVVEARTVPAMARITVRVDDIASVESTPVSTVVHSDAGLPLIVERTMCWDQSGYGAHTEKAAGGTALTWYFAEGAQGFFSTYLLLANPGATPSTATVQYLREGASVVTRSYTIGARSRLTVGAGDDPDLANSSFGMFVTFDQPGIAERAMYFGLDPVWKGGHESAGVTVPSATWFLAEGATGPFFETFVLLANPNGADTQATLTFLSSDGAPVVREKTIPANGRLTVNIESEDPSLANAAVSTQIASAQPIIVERAQYWPDPAPAWYEAHNSFGVTATGMRWGLAEGRAGGAEAYQTYILIANPGTATAHVTITFLPEDGTPVVKSFAVGPTSRFNVATGEGTDVPELANRRFGAVLTSDQPIVVERAMYANAGGQTWAAGTNATATRLP